MESSTSCLAAYRADITELIVPKRNEKDLDEIPPEVRESLEFHLVESMDEVLSWPSMAR